MGPLARFRKPRWQPSQGPKSALSCFPPTISAACWPSSSAIHEAERAIVERMPPRNGSGRVPAQSGRDCPAGSGRGIAMGRRRRHDAQITWLSSSSSDPRTAVSAKALEVWLAGAWQYARTARRGPERPGLCDDCRPDRPVLAPADTEGQRRPALDPRRHAAAHGLGRRRISGSGRFWRGEARRADRREESSEAIGPGHAQLPRRLQAVPAGSDSRRTRSAPVELAGGPASLPRREPALQPVSSRRAVGQRAQQAALPQNARRS